MPGASAEAITGRLGVGAICFLGVFLFVDGMQIGVFQFVELYGASATFGIVVALPTTVVSYLLGVFCYETAELALTPLSALRKPDPAEALVVSAAGSSVLEQRYGELVRTAELLQGATVAFVVLAIGTVSELRNMPGFESIVFFAVAGSLVLCGLSILFASRAYSRARALAESAGSPPAA